MPDPYPITEEKKMNKERDTPPTPTPTPCPSTNPKTGEPCVVKERHVVHADASDTGLDSMWRDDFHRKDPAEPVDMGLEETPECWCGHCETERARFAEDPTDA